MVEVFKHQSREVLLTATSRLGPQTAFYIFTAYIFSYGIGTVHVSREFLLTAVMSAAVLSFFTIPFFGWPSDRIGRKRTYMIGTAALGLYAFLYFALLDTQVPGWLFLAVLFAMVPHDMAYGPQAAMIAECFAPQLRYTGASLGYHLASVVAGGPAPLIAVALYATYRSGYAIAGYICVSALVSIAATALLPDYTGKDARTS